MKERLNHLDGLRGIAAVVVVVFHFMSAISPWLVADQQHNAYWLAYSPLAVLWNGTFAVSIFFVLSGIVVTNATLRKSDPIWVDAAIRYLRLALPAGVSILYAWLLLNAYPTAARELSGVTGSRWLQWTYQGEIPGLKVAIYNGLIGVFLTGGSFYNNVLWTMRPELVGSFVCFVICIFSKSSLRFTMALLFAAIVISYGKYEYVCFAIGIWLREIWVAGRLPSVLPVPALMLGLFIGSQSGDAAEVYNLNWLPQIFKPEDKGGLLYPIAATLVVYGCIRSDTMIAILSRPFAKFLGSISFPLYLIHVPFIYTVFSFYYVRAPSSAFATTSLIIASIFTIVASAYALERWIERPFLLALSHLRKSLKVRLARGVGISRPR